MNIRKLRRWTTVLEIERKCIERNENNECDRNCEKCDLVMDSTKLLETYDELIDFIRTLKKLYSFLEE